MKSIFRHLVMLCLLVLSVAMQAQTRRPIDSRHPLWMIHIDVWNLANPQRIIDMVPADIRPYVCMNLSLSCQYDTKLNIYKKPQDGVSTLRSWATVCQQNGMWFTCQPASGGHTHIQDNDLATFESFFKDYPNFLGWNYAEQFWGFDEPNDKSSSSQASRLALFANLVNMSHKYGGFLTVSFCGNMWSYGLSPLGMLKRNANLMAACKKHPDAILWLYKYTQSGCYYNSESTTWGPFIAGLANNYGVRYDRCGWEFDKNIIAGSDNNNLQYPLCAGVSTVMEQTCVNGGAVWDGPETIPTECFNAEKDTRTTDGYMAHQWTMFPGFKNVWIDMFRKIIDGTLYIPTRKEVLGKTKVVVINNINYGSDEDKYAGWKNIYDGLYKQDDPFNKKATTYQTGDGDFMNNMTWFKKTGRYGALPIVPLLYDDLAKAIPVQVKKSARWSTISSKVQDFTTQYPEVSTGDLYVNRFRNQLITYTPYSYFNVKTTASATIPLAYNTCQELQLTWGKLSTGAIREYADHIDFYLNNYRTDTTQLVTDRITVTGANQKPTYSMSVGTANVDHVAKANAPRAIITDEQWNDTTGTYSLSVKHCGSVNLTLHCAGTATGRATDYLPATHLDTPTQPLPYTGPVTIEAEDMDYRSIQDCPRDPYYTYQSERGHHGCGFVVMGSNKRGSLRHVFQANKEGNYQLTIRYMNTHKEGNLQVKANDVTKLAGCQLTNVNEWKEVKLGFKLNKGNNTIKLNNIDGLKLYIDQVTYSPSDTVVSDDPAYSDSIYNNPDNPGYANVILRDSFSIEGAGMVPQGWVMANGDDTVMPGRASSGPRIFAFPEGSSFTYGLYIRTPSSPIGYGLYGSLPGHEVPLKAKAKYNLSLDAAAWKNNPWLKVEVLDSNLQVVKSTIIACEPNIGGSTANVFTGATHVSLNFTVPTNGNYLFRFSPVVDEDGNTGYWLETMIGNIALSTDTSTGIRMIKTHTDAAAKAYNLYGQRVNANAKGLLIVNGKKIIRR